MTDMLVRRDQDTDSRRDEHVRTQGDGRLRATERGLRRHQPCQYLDLRHLASRIMSKCLSFKLPCLRYFVMLGDMPLRDTPQEKQKR